MIAKVFVLLLTLEPAIAQIEPPTTKGPTSAPNAAPTSAPTTFGAFDDPHFRVSGGRFDFKGKDGFVYNLLSHASLTLNAMFTHTDYTDAGPRARKVHGSFMTGAFAVIRTALGRVVRMEYDATRAVQIRVSTESDAGMKTLRAPVTLTFDDIILTLADRAVTITTPVFKVVASSRFKKGILRGTSCATGKCFLNVAVSPLNYSAFDKVAPHGLIGQVYCSAPTLHAAICSKPNPALTQTRPDQPRPDKPRSQPAKNLNQTRPETQTNPASGRTKVTPTPHPKTSPTRVRIVLRLSEAVIVIVDTVF